MGGCSNFIGGGEQNMILYIYATHITSAMVGVQGSLKSPGSSRALMLTEPYFEVF